MPKINAELCQGCGTCITICPNGALYLVDGKINIDRDRCRECDACARVCPTSAIVATRTATRPASVTIPVPTAVETAAKAPAAKSVLSVQSDSRPTVAKPSPLSRIASALLPKVADLALEVANNWLTAPQGDPKPSFTTGDRQRHAGPGRRAARGCPRRQRRGRWG